MSCQSPVCSKIIGGQGINNSKMSAAGTLAYVDSERNAQWIEVISASFSVVSNAGNYIARLFICPESERSKPNFPIPQTNGAGPIANNIGIWFTGVCVPTDLSQTALKALPSNTKKPIYLPPGFFLRAAQLDVNSDASAVVHLTYLWRYCDSDKEGNPIIPHTGQNPMPEFRLWDYRTNQQFNDFFASQK